MVLANSASARHYLLGEDDQALEDAARALSLFRTIGDPARQAQCEETIAGVEARRGHLDEARRTLRTSLTTLDGTGNAVLQVQHLRSLALVEIDDGDSLAAERCLDRAQAICNDSDLVDLFVELISITAIVRLLQKEPEEALTLAREAVSRITPGVERTYLLHHRHALAAEAAGKSDEARAAALLADSKLRDALVGLSSVDYEGAVQRVPEHWAIVTAAEELAPAVIEVLLPAADAPTGKTLEKENLRHVHWTIACPEDSHLENEIARRRARIRRLLEEARSAGAVPSIDHLADALSVSPSTIRRDLKALRAQGITAQTRGQLSAG